MKIPVFLVVFVGLCEAQTTVNGGRDYKGTLKASGAVSEVDFSGAGTTAPAKTGLLASRPAACNQGQLYFATDAVAGQNLYFCTTSGSPGTWSQMSGSQATTGTAGSGTPAGNCTPPAIYIDTVNQDLWFCGAANVWKKPATDTNGLATLSGTNSWSGYNNLSVAQWRPPESTVANLPAPAGNTGKVFMVTDAAGAGACSTGGGSVRELCRSNGAQYECVGGCGSSGGGGTPGGSDGQLQVNSNGAFAGQPSIFSGGGSNRFQRGTECATGTVSLSGGTWTYPGGTVAAATATSQEITIITGLNGNSRFAHVLVAESTQFAGAGITATKVSLGRPGSTTNDELLPQTNFMQSSGNAWSAFDRPQPPVIGSANTYTLVLAIRTTGGNVSALTSGSAYYEVCGYAVQ